GERPRSSSRRTGACEKLFVLRVDDEVGHDHQLHRDGDRRHHHRFL
ncbi:MAG: hypothetical protein AVDCRST_MAG23-1577, partial [uncultured Sphingosinicella sp.]